MGFVHFLVCPAYVVQTLSYDFLSMIFGFFGKFRIDIGVQKKFQKFYSKWKCFLKKYFWGNFENFWKISKFYKDFFKKLIFQILTF